jgi:hypothetical protein
MNNPGQVKKTVEKPPAKKPPEPVEARVRGENEAGPRLINLMTGTWVPHSMEPARASANNHLAIKSLKP